MLSKGAFTGFLRLLRQEQIYRCVELIAVPEVPGLMQMAGEDPDADLYLSAAAAREAQKN
jgi:hypothetical protein